MTHVLFLCPHGAAKSVIATAMFRAFADQRGIAATATNAGTLPDAEIHPIARDALEARGVSFDTPPRQLTDKDIEEADIVVSLGVPLEDLPTVPRVFINWSDAPNATEDVDGLCRMITDRIPSLLARGRAGPSG